MQTTDRRKLRSRRYQRATELLLDTVADATDLEAIAVATDDGLLFAAAGDRTRCDVLAAFAPMLSRTADDDTRGRLLDMLHPYLPGTRPERVHFRAFRAHGQELVLCALARGASVESGAVFRAITGVRRIAADTSLA